MHRFDWGRTALLMICLAMAPGCGGGEDDASRQSGDGGGDNHSTADGAARTGDGSGASGGARSAARGGGEKIDPAELANPHRLKRYLPASAAGLSRSTISAQEHEPRSPVMTTSASAMYFPPGAGISALREGKSVDISITDSGSMSSMLGMLKRDIDMTRDGTTAKSATIDGFRALEMTETNENRASIQLLVTGRVMVDVTGNDVPLDALREVVEGMNLKALADQIESGEITEPTQEQKTALVDQESLKAVMPQTLLGEQRQRVNAYAMDSRGIDRPRTIVDAHYGSSGGLAVHVEAFKSPAHATQEKPLDPEHVKRMYAPMVGSAAQTQPITWSGHEGVLVIHEGRRALALLHVAHHFVQITGPGDAAQMQEIFEAIGPEKLVAMTGDVAP